MRTLAVYFPAGECGDAFKAISFQAHQTLIWMKKEFPKSPEGKNVEMV